MITLTVYQHVHPGIGRQAADRYAALLRGWSRVTTAVSRAALWPRHGTAPGSW